MILQLVWRPLFAQSSLPATLVDLVYLRVSQINNCAYCLDSTRVTC
jgi:alkylhydroperoxidase family enzyme